MPLDANQILALAPDPASAKAGSQLAVAHHWSNLGRSAAALWGKCQGSGKTPYKTWVDLNGPPSNAPAPAANSHASTVSACISYRQPTRHCSALADQVRKREEKREDKVDAGMRELQTWLHDLAREGLAAVRSRGQGMWDGIAARIADAQAAPPACCTNRACAMPIAWWRTNSHRSIC